MQILDRNDMRKIMAGSSDCNEYNCFGCNRDDSSHGPCVKWVCKTDSCVPETSDCCIATEIN